MKKTGLLFTLLILLSMSTVSAQRKNKNNSQTGSGSPKLTVGIVVDQMRYDYLTRFWDHYGEGGFKRLTNEGFNCKNHHFNYMPTKTAAGHAAIYTGTTPSIHGVLGNWWYDRMTDEMIYCVADDNQKPIGTNARAGKMSPKRMLVSTITDELRISSQMKAKTVGIAIKDRGAILPVGFTANAAFWFDENGTGNWISSSFYMDELPAWVKAFNSSNTAEKYKKPWTPLKSIEFYEESGNDARDYERRFKGEESSTFPHDLVKIWEANGRYSLLRETPFGNSLTTDFALAAIEGEELGTDEVMDFLTISYSSTDYVGHAYGVYSKEIQDTYLRLDKDLERLLEFLDEKVGEGVYTVFLTADHGAPPSPGYLQEVGIPSGFIDEKAIFSELKEFISYRYGTSDILKSVSNFQVFLDNAVISNLDIPAKDIQLEIAQKLLKNDKVEQVYTRHQMSQSQNDNQIAHLVQLGFNQKRSGDVLFVPPVGYILKRKSGTDHGSPFIYDTHVPLLFYGNGIKKGSTVNRTEIPDIAPTLAIMMGIAFPNGTTGRPIAEVLK